MEQMTLRRALNSLPYLWSEAAGHDYFAEFAIPVDNVVEGLQYLGNVAGAAKERMSLHPIDQTEAAGFTIPYKLYNPTTKKWMFDSNELNQKFESLLVQINTGTR
jgi:hypothetical protein